MESLTGTVERVTFHTEDTGYSVLKVKIRGRTEPVTVTGRVPVIHAGEVIDARGEWVVVVEWGRQFKAETIQTTAPSSREGIERYLSSGLVDGIGPVYAKKLVDRFGEEIFDIIEHNSAKLEEVPGVGSKRRREIKSSWEKQKSIRRIMVFLHQHGISTGKAVKIFHAYGETAIEQVTANPYKLARDIHGIGFKTADAIAKKLGMAEDAPERLQAGIFHLLLAAGDEGHCALPRDVLLTRAVELLGAPAPALEHELADMLEAAELTEHEAGGHALIFPAHLARAEGEIAARMKHLAAQPSRFPAIAWEQALAWVQRVTGKELAAGQREAVHAALTSRLLILTGGPGVGKTTILQCILRILEAKQVKFVLAAPTGRAARRMSESCGHEAKTIHRSLEYQPGSGFQRHREHPLKGDLFVLDETSMVDTSLMAHWLRAIPEHAHLLLAGDADQLPSVGPGNLLGDLIASEVVRVVRLTEIFRQAAASRIITAAHAVNEGRMPDLSKPVPAGCDFHFIERDTPEAILDTIVHLARDRIPGAFGFDPVRDVQILTPMNRTLLGATHLNTVLQNALNPPNEIKSEIERFGLTFRSGDKVIQTRNNYEKDIFNGDIGTVGTIEADPVRMLVHFDDERHVICEAGDMDEMRLAYAISIHKSQGSEFPAVIIPVSTQHYVMLQRNLIYTGITRGRKLVVLVGDPKALGIAVRNGGGTQRWTGLLEKLRS